MKTIEDFFEEVEEFHDDLDSRSTDTIHTQSYESTVRELYADWHQVKISLKAFVGDDLINELDKQFSGLLEESHKSRSSVSESANYLKNIERVYIKYIYPDISHREIEADFVNNLVSDLEQIEEDKYHDYMEEAIQCIQAGAYRGAVVLGWQAGMFAIYRELEENGDPIHVAYEKKFGTTPDVNIGDFWDFQKMKDRDILILAESVGLIDKSLKDILDRDRDVRNKAAHPGVYDVGPNGTKALLETVMQLLVELGL